MTEAFFNEKFKEIILDDSTKLRYAISNYGRLISFADNIADGRILKGGITNGYRILRYVIYKDGKSLYRHKMIYRIVAEQFLEKTSDDQTYVLHLDRNRSNDHVNNLRWATKAEMLQHSKDSPYVQAAKKKLIEHRIQADGQKLTATKVMHLKMLLANPNRKTRMKILAKQFGVSTMQLYRIKTGENWGHIKI